MRLSAFTALLLLGCLQSLVAQDTVTIPRTRLEELERKEAELEKLKADLKTAKGENQELKKQHQVDAARITAVATQPVVTHVSPPMASLPALSEGDRVDAMDLANYYHTDPTAADRRFRKRVFTVQGEIIAFDRIPFVSGYRIVLKTAEREQRVVCEIIQPEQYRAMLTIKNGLELVGQTASGSRLHIAKVGDTVEITGQCRGANDAAVKMNACELKAVH